ncbi:MAG: flagellar biosynthetic protein FliO [Actinobacteria bacterium]|nr:flagellar biosynthetic protein FliO [Actinomycetota bacterium]
MDISKDRRDILAIGRISKPAMAFGSQLCHLSKPLGRIALILPVSLIVILCFTSIAAAEPITQASDLGKAGATSPSSLPDEMIGASAESKREKSPLDRDIKASLDNRNKVASLTQPNPEPGDEFSTPAYTDPDEYQGEQSFIAQLLHRVIGIAQEKFYLALIIVAGFLVIYGIKVFVAKHKAAIADRRGLLNILEIRYLAPGKAICLVEVADKVLVLGMTGSSISQLSELTDIEQVDALKQLAARKPELHRPFQAYIEKLPNRSPGSQEKGIKRLVRGQQDIAVEDNTHWREDLRSAGENISKILEEIKKQDKISQRDSGSIVKRGRDKIK